MYQIIFTNQAHEDAEAIYEWMRENRSPEYAERWYRELFQQAETLAHYPRRCPLAAESDKFPVEIRELLHGRSKTGKYRILFRVDGDAVSILYVRHAARSELEP